MTCFNVTEWRKRPVSNAVTKALLYFHSLWRNLYIKGGGPVCPPPPPSLPFLGIFVYVYTGLINQCVSVDRWYTRLYRDCVPELCP